MIHQLYNALVGSMLAVQISPFFPHSEAWELQETTTSSFIVRDAWEGLQLAGT